MAYSLGHRKKIWRLGSCVTLILVSIGSFSFQPKSQIIDLATPTVSDIKSLVTRMYQFQNDLVCQPDTNVNILDEVLLNTSDYHASLQELNIIKEVYDTETVIQAGYLTSQKAY
jgi:hypothetical protein